MNKINYYVIEKLDKLTRALATKFLISEASLNMEVDSACNIKERFVLKVVLGAG